jgi:hypothetical protein
VNPRPLPLPVLGLSARSNGLTAKGGRSFRFQGHTGRFRAAKPAPLAGLAPARNQIENDLLTRHPLPAARIVHRYTAASEALL